MLNNTVALKDERRASFEILYPEQGWRTGEQIIGYAKDSLATAYMRANPDADAAAVEENARIRTVAEAMEILTDSGEMTFTRGSLALAEGAL